VIYRITVLKNGDKTTDMKQERTRRVTCHSGGETLLRKGHLFIYGQKPQFKVKVAKLANLSESQAINKLRLPSINYKNYSNTALIFF
jgi:hypothetical protein